MAGVLWSRPLGRGRLNLFGNCCGSPSAEDAEAGPLACFGRAAVIVVLAIFASVGLSSAAHAATCSIPISYTAIGQTTTTDIQACDPSGFGAYLVQGTDAANTSPYAAATPRTFVTSNATYQILFVAEIGGVGADKLFDNSFR